MVMNKINPYIGNEPVQRTEVEKSIRHIVVKVTLNGMNTLSGKTVLSKCFQLFPFRLDFFQNVIFYVQESKQEKNIRLVEIPRNCYNQETQHSRGTKGRRDEEQIRTLQTPLEEVTKFTANDKMAEKLPSVSIPLKIYLLLKCSCFSHSVT